MQAKPELQSPSQLRPFDSAPDTTRIKFLALIGFVILAIGAILVVFLPGYMAKQRDKANMELDTPVSELQAENVALSQENTDGHKQIEAKELLQKILKLQARLENESAKIWGAKPLQTSYGEVIASLDKANSFFDQKLFDQAITGYRETYEKIEQLANSRPERITNAIIAGDDALEKMDSESAKRHFNIVLAADPNNSKALDGLKRAEKLPQVLALFTQGQNHEAIRELEAARQLYQEAISLDNKFYAAKEHLHRVNILIKEKEFQRAMSDAISALNSKKFRTAQNALNKAQNLRPDDPSVKEIDRQLRNAKGEDQLRRMMEESKEYEKSEKWDLALEVYERILKIDSKTTFASHGKQRVKEMIDLIQQIQKYLSNPEDLQTRTHMEHARTIYDIAVTKRDRGPKFRDKTEKLHELIEKYNKPVSVLLISDGITNVRVNRVGNFGQIQKHLLKLKPGHYKAHGMRSGYRDINISFEVPVGGDKMTLEVFCKEKI